MERNLVTLPASLHKAKKCNKANLKKQQQAKEAITYVVATIFLQRFKYYSLFKSMKMKTSLNKLYKVYIQYNVHTIEWTYLRSWEIGLIAISFL